MQITGSPIAFKACQCQVDSGPVSSPIRTACGALARTVAAMSSGVEGQVPRQTTLPV
jgi:hypothetical protein